ncbi:glucan biosynthesis protein G [Ramlibacter tataouinensis]|uniref:Glucans biosynthesis protein G n=1 Tax=Ramlibacter tataouinensis (strain ATCC BAA-407 / DSM 14655 / LMG 21543 / TTB310) TaxID=365046 RepID=F5Y007_RAMTT|nr:glucan biosynthesis protein G [Ramlibacter tataouinensis]AEG94556.1 candidate glucans biosynthesis protein G [Ramlibacter tataouinensis TTB310]
MLRPPALSLLLSWRLVCAIGLALSALPPAWAQGFDFDRLTQLARQRAQAPHNDPSTPLPPALAALDYDGLRDIRFRPGRALWRDAGLPFEAMFFHRGKYHPQPVRVNEVLEGGKVRPIRFNRADFDYGKNPVDPTAWGDLGFAGFRIHYPLNNTAYKDELAVFLGASYFRALGAGQQYGLSARGLAIDTVGGSGPEEFPRFSEFWLERPAPGAQQLVLYALLESPRATGAYRFVLRPGPESVTEVRARVFLRAGAGQPVTTLGIAPLTSMFLFGENQPRPADFRPEVHDSDGLMIATASGEWLWRPLVNPRQPLTNSFTVDGLRGFGLMQRDRGFASYEDTEARYERRPSAWVRPIGDWGPGRVELFQLPTPDETHDNIVAYWVPARLPAPGEPLEFAYELAWQGDEQQRPPNGWAVQSRRGLGFVRPEDMPGLAGTVQYVVDFDGPALRALPVDAAVRPVATADANGRIEQQLAYFNPATRTWRMTLRVRPIDAARPVELRAFLQHGNDILSETWTNIILPDAAL